MTTPFDEKKLASLVRRDILSFGISFIDLLEDRHWEVSTRAWATDTYATVNPWYIERRATEEPRRMVVMKSTQAGVSSNMMVRAFHFASNWSVRIGYTLPREQDVLDFVGTRIEPMIKSSPFLLSRLGEPNNLRIKRIGDSYIYYMELSVEPRMLPLDALFIDEVDLSNPDNLATALNRLDASRWRLLYYLSTPTIPNYGIHGLYNASDMREWLVKCPKCNHEQPIDWEVNLRVFGPASKPTSVFYGCAKCSAELTIPHIQTGRWVAAKPDISTETVGFHIHQMLTTPAPILYGLYRDPQTKMVEFYRKRLGKPFEIGGGSLERDDILSACFDMEYEPEFIHDGHSVYYLGVDQGNELQVIVFKMEHNSRRLKIVHVEIIPIDKGFSRLHQLMDIFRIRKGVGDGNPNRHGMLSMVRAFPGRFIISDYIEQQKEFYIAKFGMKELPKVRTNVTINRTTGFDNLMESIRKGEWAMPGKPPELPQEVELLIDHITAIKRDVETRRSASGETQVAVWKKLRAEHLAHAMLFAMIAKNIDRGSRSQIVIIGAHKEEPEEQNDKGPNKDRVSAVISLLAEVPITQIINFLEKPDDVLPFPLSFKLERCRTEGLTEDEILDGIAALIEDNSNRK